MSETPEWEVWDVLPWQRLTLIDGREFAGHIVMRRKVEGAWQYRECTADEEHDYVSREAW